ncbi:hypothetical protein [Sphingomonas bacterium]|uniref:hypothetical protein n=1 Tax=Sphingomonas bacterium TaxID=1895847 RepID=UPI0015777406|nr:hypothetical protein [Sphingomonas bacterium]
MLFLAAAAVLDVTQQAYNSDLIDAIARRGPNRTIWRVLVDSPVMATIEHWALFCIGFGILSLAMTLRKPKTGPDIIG